MAFSLSWLPEILDEAGLKVAEQPGWLTRGHGPMGSVRGVICHHTAGPRTGNMPSLGVVTNGRPGLSGPLSQLCLGRDGTYYVIAAGRASHAGAGHWEGITSGNSSFIGIEAENSGRQDDPWPEVQKDAYRRGVAAILTRIGASSRMCCGHKEYALPAGRKPDPSFDMDDFRTDVAAIIAGTGAARPLIPAADAQSRPTLRRGDRGAAVRRVQDKVGAGTDGIFGAATEVAVRRFQSARGLVPDGIVGPRTWAAIEGS
ncbi:MAG TPA: peptidoglycan-binding domain-containing protein [Allosphingosinicella sp.]|jgi:hypothetical protein